MRQIYLALMVVIVACIFDRQDCEANDNLEAELPPRIITSIKELKSLQWAYPEKGFSVDLRVTLVFANEFRRMSLFQDQDLPVTVRLPQTENLRMAGLHPGVRVRIKGRTRPHEKIVNADSMEIVDLKGSIESVPGNTSPGQAGTPLNRLGWVDATIGEVLLVHFNTRYRATQGAHPVDIWLFKKTSLEDAIDSIGQNVRAEGAVNRTSHDGGQLPLHKLLLMRRDQMRPIESDSKLATNPAQSFSLTTCKKVVHIRDATVLFSNRVDKIAVLAGGKRYCVRTASASDIAPTDRAEIVGESWDTNFRNVVCLDSKVIHVQGQKPLPAAVACNEAELANQAEVSPRVCIRGTVERVGILDHAYQLRIRVNETDVKVVIPYDKEKGSGLVALYSNATVTVTGLPLAKLNEDAPSSSNSKSPLFSLLVASPDDVKVVPTSVALSVQQVSVGIVAILFLFCAGAIWNHLLRRTVASQTSSLIATTTQMRTAFEATREAVLVTDADGIIRHSNHRFEEIFGFQPPEGAPITTVSTRFQDSFEKPELLQGMLDRAKNGVSKYETAELEKKNGLGFIRVYTNLIETRDGVCHGRLWMLSDITKRRRLEQELRQAQKMEAIGHLSGGVAHDFNNFLTVIRSSLAMIEHEGSQQSDTYVSVANVAVDRAADLTQQLLGYARKSRLEQQVVSANQLVHDVVSLLRHSCSASIDLRTWFDPADLAVRVDPSRMQQALMNLCLNSLDAVQEDGGVVQVSVRQGTHAKMEDAVLFTVHDDGPGIPKETLRKVFEPFFTTKDVGDGTGLGLSVAQGVIDQHGGLIECESSLEHGTEFRILLPRCKDAQPKLCLPQLPSPSTSYASLKLLVVDDEQIVRETAVSLLQKQGHTVSSAANGVEALRKLVTDGPFDVVILDLAMPEMSGVETLREIRSEWHDQPVVFCSGFADNHSSLKDIPEEELPPLIAKPFAIEDLQQALFLSANRARSQKQIPHTAA
ncbi:MAG: ATP-binding protein [Rubripirellula sp.]